MEFKTFGLVRKTPQEEGMGIWGFGVAQRFPAWDAEQQSVQRPSQGNGSSWVRCDCPCSGNLLPMLLLSFLSAPAPVGDGLSIPNTFLWKVQPSPPGQLLLLHPFL